jgi:hypothetical protein
MKFDDMPRLQHSWCEGKSYIVVFEKGEEVAFFRPDQITSVELAQLVMEDTDVTGNVRGSEIRLADGRKFIVRDHPGCVLTMALKS